ncbi:HpcH/HpaI aldolase/citrate lyase family protein [Stagnihabitans tardus]|uniref:CoA ester lyase n=1 Tax=Stagnihabitans tardus TaxID=2699202 RepID=A0AAE5BUA5_9RHOB|nr:CoA ester lyase [Stagnihabitans tardus]NBZ87651.1 CoA ester lyase [Stagnihabitans tardus]
MALMRSVLYIPGSKARALDKAASLPCDAIIFDLEDAVAPGEKVAARDLLAQMLSEVDYGPRLRLVRVNGAGTEWGAADVAAFADHPGVDGILLPKVNGPADLDLPGEKPLWAMMETPLAMLNAGAIAAHPRLAGLVMGTNDLLKDLGARFRPDRAGLATGLGLCLLAARAHGKLAVDGVYNAFKDLAGLEAECIQGRDLGFDGKTLIHPDQLEVANRIFAPSEAEVDLARRQIAAFEEAATRGEGVAVLDGKIVENLHIVTARATLDKARAIAGMT